MLTIPDTDIDLDRVLFDLEYRRRVVEHLNEAADRSDPAPDPQPDTPAR